MVPELTHNVADESRALLSHFNEEGVRIMRAARAEEAWFVPVPVHSHIASGTVMGDDSAALVADSYGRLHEADNVLVAGAGPFPSIGAVSPTFIMLAMAERTAERLVKAGASSSVKPRRELACQRPR
jgi:choline dehydrogenase-like flavoprotein